MKSLFQLAKIPRPWSYSPSSHSGGELAQDVQVVHHVNGRIRLRIPRLAHDDVFTRRLVDLVEEQPAVIRTRVRRHSRSFVVEYENHALGPGKNGQDETHRAAILSELARAIQEAAGEESAPTLTTQQEENVDSKGHNQYLQRLGLPALGLGMSAGAVAGLAIPPLLVGGTILVSAFPIFKRTVEGIREDKRLHVDFLDSTAIVLMTAQASFLPPAFIVSVIEGSEMLRDWTAKRKKQASLALLMDQQSPVTVEQNSQEKRISMSDLAVGDVILVYPGDRVPVDGLVLDGRATVDQHQVTGDSIPVLCSEGDTVHASTLVIEGHLRLQAQRTGHETHVGQVMAVVQAAPETDTRVTNYARKVGNWAVLPTLATSGLVFGGSGSLARATGIVNMDLGTGMRVSSPIAILKAQTNAARQGILIRSGLALEALSRIDAIVFDKTATLTEGRARIVEIEAYHDGVTERDVLTLAASAEMALRHPIAESIVRFAHDQEIETVPCTEWNYLAGLGVEARINGQLVHVGNHRFMSQLGLDTLSLNGPSHKQKLESSICVHVARSGKLIGRIYCADPIRPESVAVIAELQASQIVPYMISGDGRSVTNAVGARLGFAPDRVSAEALPQQKLELVKSLQEKGRIVAFVGDGINDAAAMTRADVSVAMGHATDLAQEVADIVLLNDDLRDLIEILDIARHTMRIITQNKALVVVPNVGGIAYGALAAINPIAGVVINNGSALAAALNSLRPMRTAKKTRQHDPIEFSTNQPTLMAGVRE